MAGGPGEAVDRPLTALLGPKRSVKTATRPQSTTVTLHGVLGVPDTSVTVAQPVFTTQTEQLNGCCWFLSGMAPRRKLRVPAQLLTRVFSLINDEDSSLQSSGAVKVRALP